MAELRPAPGRGPALKMDLLLLVTTLVLAALGMLMIYSATRDKLRAAGYSPNYYLDRQAEFVVIGVLVMVAVAAFDYRHLEHLYLPLFGGLLLALSATYVIGKGQLGAVRWIPIGPFQFQPSTFAVLGEIVAVATFCARRSEGLQRQDVWKVLGLMVVPIALVVKEPDLGSGVIMATVLMVMMIAAGIPNRYLVLLGCLAVLGAYCVVHFGLLQHYQVDRITSFLDQPKAGVQVSGSSTASKAVYNLAQSKAAIGSGGFWGTGLFKGLQTNNAYVPEQQTDFIFSAVGEQLGFIGATTTLLLIGLVCFRLLRAAQLARDLFGRYLCVGAFTLIAFSAVENAGMSMGIMPIAGIPLPFLSYGGSAVVCFFVAVGLGLSVQLRAQR